MDQDEFKHVRYLAVDNRVSGSYLGMAYAVAVATAATR
jgi:hypothetical protein